MWVMCRVVTYFLRCQGTLPFVSVLVASSSQSFLCNVRTPLAPGHCPCKMHVPYAKRTHHTYADRISRTPTHSRLSNRVCDNVATGNVEDWSASIRLWISSKPHPQANPIDFDTPIGCTPMPSPSESGTACLHMRLYCWGFSKWVGFVVVPEKRR